MDVDNAGGTGVVQQPPDSPVETLSEIGSKKHRMQTGEENDVFTRWVVKTFFATAMDMYWWNLLR